jgi:hypothetical protein
MNPRPTRAIIKTADAASKGFEDLLADEHIRWRWSLFAYATLKRLGLQHPVRERIEKWQTEEGGSVYVDEGEDEMIFATNLLDAIKDRRPDVYHIIGENLVHLQQWTFAVLEAWAPDDATKEALHKAARTASPQSVRLEHFPDNPITVRQDPVTGEYYLTDYSTARVRLQRERSCQ